MVAIVASSALFHAPCLPERIHGHGRLAFQSVSEFGQRIGRVEVPSTRWGRIERAGQVEFVGVELGED